MLLELLRLRLRLLRNSVLFSKSRALLLVIEALVLVAVIIALFTGAARLATMDDAIVFRIVAVAGSAICTAAFWLPLMTARPELMERRAFRGYGIRAPALAALLLPVSALSPLLPVVVAVSCLPLVVWGGSGHSTGDAVLVALVLAVQLGLTILVGRAIGAHLRTRRVLLAWVRIVGILLLVGFLALLAVMSLPRAIPLATEPLQGTMLRIIDEAARVGAYGLSDRLAGSPIGALWVALAPVGLGEVAVWGRNLTIGLVTIIALVIAWFTLVFVELQPTRRVVPVTQSQAPVAFRGVPSTPLGAVAVRSGVYWSRDPRYRAVLVFLPVIPVVVLLAAWIGGVPVSTAALLPLPLMLLLLGWATLHNDVAYDSTAMWSLLAAQLDGRADRVGRALPVLVLGLGLMLIGVPLTVWARGEIAALPVVLGVNLAILFGAVGVSSGVSVRSPYPAPRPGDGAFQQPVVGGTQGVGAQATSLSLILGVATPSVVAALLWLLEVPGPWAWLSFAFGVGLGGAALVLGIRRGARDYDVAAPELLDYTMRN